MKIVLWGGQRFHTSVQEMKIMRRRHLSGIETSTGLYFAYNTYSEHGNAKNFVMLCTFCIGLLQLCHHVILIVSWLKKYTTMSVLTSKARGLTY